ncbi:MFS transporter [Corynebacterium aquilae]|uniref:MFS transporter n=1 Tax=Corynebacterium aquilae TaxID=203263 RepID=UPI001FEA5E53|nr:MFS transporter [Corynebacterium aquilae]
MTDNTAAATVAAKNDSAGLGRNAISPGAFRALIAAMVGTLVEWYDYALYGAAASLVIGPLFFAGAESGQTVAAYATFAVGFVARPFGGLIIAHLGDKHGRKPAMMLTILVMGFATIGIGLLPTYETAGALAIVLLILLRFIQGLGAGAELTGALVLVAEYTPTKRRGYWTSFVLAMPPAGAAIAILSFLAVSKMPQDSFMAGGWRIPFLVSAVLFIVAVYIRNKLEESPEYNAAMERRAAAEEQLKVPLAQVIKKDWKAVLLGFMSVTGHNGNNYIISIASLSIMTAYGDLSRSQALTAVLCASLLAILLAPVGGLLADRFGAGTIMGFGSVVGLVFAYPLFKALTSGSFITAFAALCVSFGIVMTCTSSPQGAFMANLFDAETRFTGMALSRELNGVVIAGFTPMIVEALLKSSGGNINGAAGYMAACFAVTVFCMIIAKGRGNNQARIIADEAAVAARPAT